MTNTNLGRRRFLAVSAAAAAGATFFDLPRILQAADDPYGGFPIGVQSYSLREFKVEEAIRHIQGLGVHYVEFFGAHLPLNISDEKLAETKKLLAAAEIAISAHGVNGFGKDHEANRKWFEFAKRVGFKTITADPSPDSFESLDKLVAEFNIRIAIHNHGPGDKKYGRLEQVQAAIKGHHKLIGACVDTGHVIRAKEDPVKWIRELGDRVHGLHIKDDIVLDGGSKNVVIGKGHLDVVGVFKALKAVKFPADGSISLEYEENPKNPIEDMKACLAVAREAIAKAAMA